MNIKKYIGSRNFYKMVLAITVPIIIHNFITNFVSMLDNIMVGSLGTEEVSAVAVVNQMVFIFNLAIFGVISGAGIFISQFFGVGNEDGIRYTFRFKAAVCLAVSFLAIAVFYFFGGGIINLFLHDGSYGCDIEKTFVLAENYMYICMAGLVPYAITQMYASTLRETGETFIPMIIGFMAVGINTLFNLLLIFGFLGFPRLGVNGAAIATVIARLTECTATIVYVYKNTNRYRYFKGALKSLYIPLRLFKDICIKGLPLLINESLWALGTVLISMSYSYHGLAVVAGYSISSTVINLFNITIMSFGTSIGIIVGRYLGANDFEGAVDCDRKLIVFSFSVSLVISLLVFLVGGFIPNLYSTSAESKEYAAFFIKTSALFIPVICLANASYFTLRSGGKTFITFLTDSAFKCFAEVPVSFALYFFTNLSIWAIFPIVQSLEIVKCIIGFYLIKKRVWVNNIVEPEQC